MSSGISYTQQQAIDERQTAIDSATADLRRQLEGLKNPAAVLANILRGNIVLPSEFISKTDEFGEYQEMKRQLEEARKDSARLDWVMSNVSGGAWASLGVWYGSGCNRQAIDAAIDRMPE